MKLCRVARNVTDIAQAVAFYQKILGCKLAGPMADDSVLASRLGVARIAVQRLILGRQQLELTQCFPPGAAYPQNAAADDLRFQHIAIVTTDIHAAFAQAAAAGVAAISTAGPQLLPAAAGSVTAWKFRDPDGHPLEFLQFPPGGAWQGHQLILGYDHSAISVANAERSIGFYRRLGLALQQRQTNQGPEQARLDGIANAKVEVVAMAPAGAPPHVELLAYYGQAENRPQPLMANDIAADRLVFDGQQGDVSLQRDPDGHILLFDNRR